MFFFIVFSYRLLTTLISLMNQIVSSTVDE